MKYQEWKHLGTGYKPVPAGSENFRKNYIFLRFELKNFLFQ